VMRTAPSQMKNSKGEIFQKPYAPRGEMTRSATAWMMMAERAALGMKSASGVEGSGESQH
jgi:hypothetical protein